MEVCYLKLVLFNPLIKRISSELENVNALLWSLENLRMAFSRLPVYSQPLHLMYDILVFLNKIPYKPNKAKRMLVSNPSNIQKQYLII